jgi:nitrite reductase/ring-hydroxylating ferredoxin subunit
MASYTVAKTSEIPEGECKSVTVEGEAIALFHVGGKFYATEDTCKHRGGSLGEGTLDETIITCPLHGWTYDVTDGSCEMNAEVKLNTYPVTIDGEMIVVEK